MSVDPYSKQMDIWGGTEIQRPDLDILFGKQVYLVCILCGAAAVIVDARVTDKHTYCTNCRNPLHVIRRGNRYAMKWKAFGKYWSEEELVNRGK